MECLKVFSQAFLFACVQTSPISFVARTKEIGDVCTQASFFQSGGGGGGGGGFWVVYQINLKCL